jgi:hypothetical protein
MQDKGEYFEKTNIGRSIPFVWSMDYFGTGIRPSARSGAPKY